MLVCRSQGFHGKYIVSHESPLGNAVVVSSLASQTRQIIIIQLVISNMAPSALHRRPNAFTVFVTLVIVALNSWITVSNAASLKHQNLHSRAQFANGVELRVLPIGEYVSYRALHSYPY